MGEQKDSMITFCDALDAKCSSGSVVHSNYTAALVVENTKMHSSFCRITHSILHRHSSLSVVGPQRLTRFSSLVQEQLLDRVRARDESHTERLRSHVLAVGVCEDVQIDFLLLSQCVSGANIGGSDEQFEEHVHPYLNPARYQKPKSSAQVSKADLARQAADRYTACVPSQKDSCRTCSDTVVSRRLRLRGISRA